MVPQLEQIIVNARAVGLALPCDPFTHEGNQYATTLRHWRSRFNENFASLDSKQYDERFRRLWNFYLAGATAAFESLAYRVAQVLLEKRV